MDGMIKRRPMLLLEMLIALVLMSGVLAFLFTGFYDAIKAKNFVKAEKEKILSEERLKLKFYTLFKNIIDIKPLGDNTYSLKYNGGIDPDPEFCTDLKAMLVLKDKRLTLITYSPEKEGAPRQELLSDSVDTLQFEYFDEKVGTFLPTFPKHKPLMVKVTINETILPLFL